MWKNRGLKSFRRTLGIGQKLQNAILLPEFADLRGTASCKYWIIDAMSMKWRALQALNYDLLMEQARIQHAKMPAEVVWNVYTIQLTGVSSINVTLLSHSI